MVVKRGVDVVSCGSIALLSLCVKLLNPDLTSQGDHRPTAGSDSFKLESKDLSYVHVNQHATSYLLLHRDPILHLQPVAVPLRIDT